ncbi:2012_t:CDS:1, partial [Acaulospora morrowiae]
MSDNFSFSETESNSSISLTFDSTSNSHNIVENISTKKQKPKEHNLGGRPRTEVWNYFKIGSQNGTGHNVASCHYCSKHWQRGLPSQMEIHLASECSKCSE